jgi:hypothetical protein
MNGDNGGALQTDDFGTVFGRSAFERQGSNAGIEAGLIAATAADPTMVVVTRSTYAERPT